MIGLISSLIVLAFVLVAMGLVARIFGNEKLQLVVNLVLLVALIAAITAALDLGSAHSYEEFLSANPFSLLLMLIFTGSALLLNLIAFYDRHGYAEFAVLSNMALAGGYIVAMSMSLLGIFLGLELAAVPAILLLLANRKSMEGAVKMFVMSAMAVAIFSFGAVLFYGATGSMMLQQYAQSPIIYVALILLLGALGVEAALFPFNLWLPDVYDDAPAHIAAMLGGLNKKIAMAALIEIGFLLIPLKNTSLLLGAIATITMFYGNVMALRQERIKRLLAYSSISQAGYILIGIAVGTQYGIAASLFQIVAHAVAFIGLLGIAYFLEFRNIVHIDNMVGLHNESRFAAFSISILLLSLLGIPFTAGFMGKFMLFSSAVYGGIAALALVGVANTVISAYYYAKVMLAMYADKASPTKMRISGYIMAPVVICVVLTLALGVFPNALVALAEAAAKGLAAAI